MRSQSGTWLQNRGVMLRAHTFKMLGDILDSGDIRCVYQPVIDIEERRIVGYEALCRGPIGEFESPAALFPAAYECGLIWKLERLCRRRALKALSMIEDHQKLFVNVEPWSIFDPDLLADGFREHASQIVFEITEHAAMDDLTSFRNAIRGLQELGFRISVDDMGAGYAGLKLISEIRPNYMKLDTGLIDGIEKDDVKKKLIKAIVGFARQTGVSLIAEGVETRQQLKALQSVGVQFLQGFLFGQGSVEIPLHLSPKETPPPPRSNEPKNLA